MTSRVLLLVSACFFVFSVSAHAEKTAPVGHILESPRVAGVPVHLMSAQFYQQGKLCGGNPTRIDSDFSLQIRCEWLAAVPMKSSAPIRVIVSDSLGLVSRSFGFRVGPTAGEKAWGAGGVYTQLLDVSIADAVQTFSGAGRIIIAVDLPRSSGREFAPTAAYSVVITPLVRESRITEAHLVKWLGKEITLLPVETTLGNGGEIMVMVPESAKGTPVGVALVSSLTYTFVPQGAAVCEMTLLGPAGEKILTVEAGEHTARCDIDAYSARALGHEKIEVFQSRDSAHMSRTGQPVQLHKFISTLPVPSDFGRIDRIRLRCDGEVFFSIYGLALVYE